jgi:4-amino-4-deoxy-L-arabinose transferase-like glycosyltransferase
MTVLQAAAAGLAIVAAVLTKGPVGFFPLAAPVMLRLLEDARSRDSKPARWKLMTAVMLAIVALCAVALALYEPSRRNLTAYVLTQLVPSLQGRREVNPNPLAAVRHLGLGIVGRMTILLALTWLLQRCIRVRGGVDAPRRAQAARTASWRPAAYFLAMGLCASMPITVSPKLLGHYFVPSAPLFALGFGSCALGPAASLMRASDRWSRRVPLAVATGLLTAALLIPLLHGPLGRRDADILRNLDTIDPVIPRDIVIGACRHPDPLRDAAWQTYVDRWYRVSLDTRGVPVNGWLLQIDDACPPPPSCMRVAGGDALTLFRCGS